MGATQFSDAGFTVLPITHTAADTFAKARDSGLGDQDIMAILAQILAMSGGG